MAVYRSGSQSQIVVGAEVAFNTTPASPAGFLMRKSRFTFGAVHELIDDDELRADPNPSRQEKGLDTVNAQLVVPVTTEEMGLWCYYFFGGYSVSGVGDPYAHVYVIDTTPPESLFVECGDLELGKYDLFQGLVITSLSFGTISKANNMLNMTIGFAASGKWTKNGASPIDASPTTYNVRKHTHPDVEYKVDDTTTALITECNYTINRRVDMYGPLDGTNYMSGFDAGDYSYDFTMSGWRDTSDTIFGYDDDAEHGLEIKSERPADATHYVSFDHNEAFIYDSEAQGEQSDDGPQIATVRVAPTYINHADASSIKVTIATETADYSAIQSS